VDEGGDDKVRAQPERGQNFDQGRPEGTLRVPWLLVRAALLVEEWPAYLGASPSKKSVQRIKAKISELLVPGNKGSWPDVGDRLILPARSHRYGSCEYRHVLQVLARDALSFASSWLS
jgi:hypothetical protein